MLEVVSALAGLLWAVFGLLGLRGLRQIPDLEPLDEAPSGSVAAIVAVRDDATAVGATVDRLLAQEHVDLRVVAVDDRSADGTGDVLAARAERDARVEVVRIDSLPDGWLGKCHACWRGAERARESSDPPPDWLLFLDADSRLAPEAIARAVRVAERTGAAHVCLLPQLTEQTIAGRAVTLAMCVGLLLQATGVERDRPGAYMGVGAFNLVRRDAYLAVGGHERLRLEVVEDVALARLLRAAGHRARIRFAVESFEVTWITTLPSVFRLLAKNYFAIFRFETLRFLAIWSAGALSWCLAVLTPFGLAGLAGLAACTVPVALRYRWGPAHALLVPLAVPVVLAVMAFSAARTLVQGGVTWRGTFYPLALLKRSTSR